MRDDAIYETLKLIERAGSSLCNDRDGGSGLEPADRADDVSAAIRNGFAMVAEAEATGAGSSRPVCLTQAGVDTLAEMEAGRDGS